MSEQWHSNDEITHGDERSPLTERVPQRWRARLALLLASCIGLVVGGYAVSGWQADRGREQADFDVSLYTTLQSEDRVHVTALLRNVGTAPITVLKARFELRGFEVDSGGLEQPERVAPHETTEVSYDVTPRCARDSGDVAAIRLRVGSGDWITAKEPVPPAYARASLTAMHVNRCTTSSEARVELHAKTLDVTRSHRELRIKLHVSVSGHDGEPPEEVRLRTLVAGDQAGLYTAFHVPRADRAASLPAEGTLTVGVENCDRIRKVYSGEAVRLRPVLASGNGTYVDTDLAYAREVFAYLADRCGNQQPG